MKEGMDTVGIVGTGVMGSRIAFVCLCKGYRVVLWGRSEASLRRAQDQIGACHEQFLGFGLQNLPPLADLLDQLVPTTDPGPMASAGLISENVVEDFSVKEGIFRRLDEICPEETLFASVTSGLSITRLGRVTARPDRMAGTHFWNPPDLMPLVEVVRGEDTSERTMEGVSAFVRRLRKVAVRVDKDVPGFIGNRLLHALWREAISLVESGVATAQDVDRVARLTFGLRSPVVGPLENMDLVGLDLIEAIHAYMLPSLAHDGAVSPLLERMVEEGHVGAKAGRGFYDWSRRSIQDLMAARDRQIVRQLQSEHSDVEDGD